MQRAPQFVTGDFRPHHKFLEDGEYGRALDALVKAVSDVLILHPDESQVYLGCRRVEPQPDWWYIGGRAKPGETPGQAAARNTRRELGLDLPEARFQVIGNYSFVWATRAQAPTEHGTADVSSVHSLILDPSEMTTLALDPEEYSYARWFAVEEVLAGEFHPALKQAIRDFRAKRAYKRLEAAVGAAEPDDATIATLSAELVARVGEGELDTPLQVNFDRSARKYSVTKVEKKL